MSRYKIIDQHGLAARKHLKMRNVTVIKSLTCRILPIFTKQERVTDSKTRRIAFINAHEQRQNYE
ncbi:MAG: hypothetical protein AAF806_00495 [Bacteroidota bacterium]